MRQTLYDYCLENNQSELLQQWDTNKNKELTPKDVTSGSKRKAWWLCNKGHEWQTEIYNRTSGKTGCPYCAGSKVWIGENDLGSQRPDIAAQWHPFKNEKLLPEQVTVHSRKTVWWVCERNHEWRAMVKTRTEGSGCPVCANRVIIPGENDLKTTHPHLAEQWHPKKNHPIGPEMISSGSTFKAWWVCEKRHEWQASVYSRVDKKGCPVCAGKVIIPGENDLATEFPEIAGEWHPTKNGQKKPEQLSPFCNQKVWWCCPLGHEYEMAVSSRTYRLSGCPYCTGRLVLLGFNDLASKEPEIAKEWHPTLNGSLTPEMVTARSSRKVWWQCNLEHVWKTRINIRTTDRKSGCPVCAGKFKKKRYDIP